MYNLLGKKRNHFGALRIQSLGKQRNVFERRRCFLTNAQLQFVWVLLLNWLKTGSTIIPADATSVTDLENLVDQAVAILGGKIDFVLHSIGMSVNVRKGNHYTNQITGIPKRDGMCQLFLFIK
jgi:enoyl-[acyl-carrier protein] reductase I